MKLETKYDPKEIEIQINSYLNKIDIQSLIDKELSSYKRTLGFVEGPPTLNGEPHVGHLRGRIIKDLWFRYKTLQKYKLYSEQAGTLKVCQLNYRQKKIWD